MYKIYSLKNPYIFLQIVLAWNPDMGCLLSKFQDDKNHHDESEAISTNPKKVCVLNLINIFQKWVLLKWVGNSCATYALGRNHQLNF